VACQATDGVIDYATFPAHFPSAGICPASYNPAHCLFDVLVVHFTTTVGLTTTITISTYDAADQLTASSTSPADLVGPVLPTTCAYDQNGNQLSAVSATGTITNTYNLQDQLVHVSGPATNVSYVYDGHRGLGPRRRRGGGAATSSLVRSSCLSCQCSPR
jgi:hypothetical protein